MKFTEPGMNIDLACPWHRSCPICGCDAPEPVHFNRMAAIDDLDMSYEVSRCALCGFHYASRLPTPGTYSRYYRTLSKYDLRKDGEKISELDRVRTEAALRICGRHVQADAGIADIGCGVGTLLQAFRTAGYRRLFGLDPSPNAPCRANQTFGLSCVKIGFLLQAYQLIPLDQVGLVCLAGVLEHLPNLKNDVRTLVDALPSSTKILIEVPSLERFSRIDAEPYGEFSLEHIHYFSQSSLVNLMAGLGYAPLNMEIVELDGATDSLFGLFSRSHHPVPTNRESSEPMDNYLAQSRQRMGIAMDRLALQVRLPFFIYGAGSHTARLVPTLKRVGSFDRVLGIVDSNPNLQGKTMAGHIIRHPECLQEVPDTSVLVSSYKAQDAIARSLGGARPLILMY